MPISIHDWRRGETWIERRERERRWDERWERIEVLIGALCFGASFVIIAVLWTLRWP